MTKDNVTSNNENFEKIKPQYSKIPDWDFYSSNLMIEYQQCIDEGIDIETYKDLFFDISKLPNNEYKSTFGDIIFDIVSNAKQMDSYAYFEPTDLEGIRDLRLPYSYKKNNRLNIEEKISGAWFGRICGCLLGKTVEGICTDELIPFLKDTENFPMHRYILLSDLTDEVLSKYNFDFENKCFADTVDGMPIDDDTNYMVLYQEIIDKYGKDFTRLDVFLVLGIPINQETHISLLKEWRIAIL